MPPPAAFGERFEHKLDHEEACVARDRPSDGARSKKVH